MEKWNSVIATVPSEKQALCSILELHRILRRNHLVQGKKVGNLLALANQGDERLGDKI